ncbi:MAG: sulfotransferase [Planctomycetota bacterium]|nr:sulfotransferase [Planctomycetota bacterium]
MCSPLPSKVVLPAAEAVAHGLDSPLHLRRVWPRHESSLAMQYTDAAGISVPAMWYADEKETQKLGQKLESVGGLLVRSGGVLLALQPNGADPKLPALEQLLQRPDASLVSHRPGRRAVIRLQGNGVAHFAKVLRPSRLGKIMKLYGLMERMNNRAFDIAVIEDADEESGVLLTRELQGTCMADIPASSDAALVSACAEAGRALRVMHQKPPAWMDVHDAGAEIGMLEERLSCARAFLPELSEALSSAALSVFDALRETPGRETVVHRDFYDKQIVIGPTGRVGILDFDTLAAGEPALDVANMLGHLELRCLQGFCNADAAMGGARAFLHAYGNERVREDAARIAAYLDATRLRLAVLYAFWPKWSGLARRILTTIGTAPCIEKEVQQPVINVASSRAVAQQRPASDQAACPLVFVVGCPRSGTTMLERMLDAHRDLAMAHETHWITKYGKRRRDVSRRGIVGADMLDRLYADRRFVRMAPERECLEKLLASQPTDYATFVRLVYDLYRRERAKAHVGDKSTGGYLRNLSRLHKICPASRVIHLIRDGRDVCLSMLTWPKARRAAGRHRLWEIDPVAATAVWWRWHVRSGIEDGRKLGDHVYREYRYEQLVADPSGQCAEICQYLGLAPDAGMAAFYQGRSEPATGRSANASWLAPTPGLRDWRTQMPDESIEMFEAIAGDTLAELGYERGVAQISRPVAALAEKYKQEWGAQKPQATASHP